MTENNENSFMKVNKNKRKTRKIALLFFLTGVTAILLVVETYAWFVGLTTIAVNDFEIGVSTDDSFKMSLDGESWDTSLSITETSITTGAYEGNSNKWVTDYDAESGEGGLIPISTAGVADTSAGGRLMLYGKSSLTATGGGFRLISNRIDNYSTTGAEGTTLTDEADGYLVFDMFIKNGTGSDYIKEYNRADDEAVYLTADSSVTVTKSGSITDDYGLANSVRVAFVQIGRVNATGAGESEAPAITCSETDTGDVTSLCEEPGNIVIWEPNHNVHHSGLVTYFKNVCKIKALAEGGGAFDYSTVCKPVGEGETATELTTSSFVPTYVVNKEIKSSDNVDIYDGLNGYSGSHNPTGEGATPLLVAADTFTDDDKDTQGADRKPFFYLAPNSITKIRVYIYLEGQDVDNYDLISNGSKVKIKFGFTKDQWNIANGGTDAGEEA